MLLLEREKCAAARTGRMVFCVWPVGARRLAVLGIALPQLLFDGDQHWGSGGLVEKALGHGIEFLGWECRSPGIQRRKLPRALSVARIYA